MATTEQTYTIERPAAGAFVAIYHRNQEFVGNAEVLRWEGLRQATVRFFNIYDSLRSASFDGYKYDTEYGFTYRPARNGDESDNLSLLRVDGKPGMEWVSETVEQDDDNPF